MKNHFVLLFFLGLFLWSCEESNQTPELGIPEAVAADSIVLSFVFVGCNRINDDSKSTANVPVLQKIYKEVAALPRKPEYFFFLGDLVEGKHLVKLDSELAAWVGLYQDPKFSKIDDPDIELVAIPGNHEMLQNGPKLDGRKVEYPLAGTTEVWMKHMARYMPAERVHCYQNNDTLNNQMTFAFEAGNVAFIVLNTDTYNAPKAGQTYGREGLIPMDWVNAQIKKYKAKAGIDHIFVLGHKPCYDTNGKLDPYHGGLPEGKTLFGSMQQDSVVALLCAHNHVYDRQQPGPNGNGTYQIIAGNGGSSNSQVKDLVFGYSIINIMHSGKIQLISKGVAHANGDAFKTTLDSTFLTWEKNVVPFAAW